MLLSIIKFTFIILCINIIFYKSLDIKITPPTNYICIVSSILLAIISILSNQIYAGLDLCVTYFLTPFIYRFIFKKNYSITMITTSFSIAISFVLTFFALVLTIPLALTLGYIMSYSYVFNLVSHILIGLITIILAHLLFKIKNFNRGIPFLKNREYIEINMLLSCGIIFIYTFFRFGQIRSIHLFIIVFSFLLTIAIFIYISNERQVIVNHQAQLNQTKILALENELKMYEDRLQHISTVNSTLDNLIHKDNKLIPAMENAVQSVLVSCDKETAIMLSKQLTSMVNERKGFLTSFPYKDIAISHLKNVRLNAIINYMYKEALNNTVKFNFNSFGNISEMITDIISEDDLCTLIADLVENAIIASSSNKEKEVFLSIQALPNNYSITIYDSGNYFSKDVIKFLGKKRYTTHKTTGGTGIGLITTFELLNKYNASFVINEKINNLPYKKYVSIIFDNKNSRTYNII